MAEARPTYATYRNLYTGGVCEGWALHCIEALCEVLRSESLRAGSYIAKT